MRKLLPILCALFVGVCFGVVIGNRTKVEKSVPVGTLPEFDSITVDYPNPDSNSPVWDSRKEVRLSITRITRNGDSVWVDQSETEPRTSWLLKFSGQSGQLVYALKQSQ